MSSRRRLFLRVIMGVLLLAALLLLLLPLALPWPLRIAAAAVDLLAAAVIGLSLRQSAPPAGGGRPLP